MTLNFVQFINQNTPQLTTQQKVDMLDDFVYQNNYTDTVDDGQGGTIPNPVSKSDFMNQLVTDFIKATVQARRVYIAQQAITTEELDL